MNRKERQDKTDKRHAELLNTHSRAHAAAIMGITVRSMYRYVQRLEARGHKIVKLDNAGKPRT
jgi:transposase